MILVTHFFCRQKKRQKNACPIKAIAAHRSFRACVLFFSHFSGYNYCEICLALYGTKFCHSKRKTHLQLFTPYRCNGTII